VNSAKDRDELVTDWWHHRRLADYSWHALAKFPLAGTGGVHGERTLQDYWRRDPTTGKLRCDTELRAAGELETAPDGSLWHIAHVPLIWPDGSAAKSRWSTEQRIHFATIIAARIAAAKETRATLKNGDELVTGVDGRAQLIGSILLDPPDHPAGAAAPIHIAATGSWFPAWYPDDNQIGPGADFRGAAFLGLVRCQGTKFLGDAGFDGATFLGGAFFGGAIFAGDAGFEGTKFVDIAAFYSTIFSGKTFFDRAVFQGGTSFERATFSGETRFYSSNFSHGTTFNNAAFSGEASFEGATFSGSASFDSATFENSAFFGGVRFQTTLDGNLQSGPMRFEKAVFAGPVNFEDVVFAANPAHHSSAFLGTRFEGLVSFRRSGDHWVAALDEAQIKGCILIDERDEADSLRDFDSVVLPLARDGWKNGATGEPLLKELEGGCRTIKVAMGAARNEIMEQRYYRFQLLARREQAGVPRIERWVSHLFGYAADYGLSLTRPLIGLGLLLLVFTVIYAIFWHATGRFGSDGLIKSIEMAASRMFPFGAFELVSKSWFEAIACRGAYPFTLLCARLFATLQSLLALLLIFLFGLAVRRRFKVGE